MRHFLIHAVLIALLSACAASGNPPVQPEPPTGCARTPVEGDKDGGFGGTGNAPQPCDAKTVVE